MPKKADVKRIATVWTPSPSRDGVYAPDTDQIRMVIAEGHMVANWTVLALCRELDFLRAQNSTKATGD